MNHSQNRLLAALPQEIFAALSSFIELVEFKAGVSLSSTGQPVEQVYFPHSGIISLVVELSVGDMIETAMVGRDGVVHASSALDGKVALNRAIVQLAGFGSSIRVAPFKEIANRFPVLRELIMRHEQVLFAQSQQSAACNASHLTEARLCRWLLRTRDLAASDELLVTQESLAQMLGVRRSSLSITATTLQKAGFIKYRRGHVTLTNVTGLLEGACECYEAVRSHYERLLHV